MSGRNKSQADLSKVLVQWVGGSDNGKYNVIDKDWLVNFDEVMWTRARPDDRESEVAEWRVGRKKNGAWKTFDCKVLEMGCNADLKKKQSVLEKEKEKENNPSDLDESAGGESEDDKKDSGNEDEEDDDDLTGKQQRDIKRRSAARAVQDLEAENQKLKLALAESVLNKSNRNEDGPVPLNPEADQAENLEDIKVPLFPDSTVFVGKTALEAAKSCGNRTTFIGDMLQQLFPRHILVVSNIKGGKAKGSGAGTLHRWALCRKKKNALIAAANHYFPKATKPMVHAAITNRINQLRFKYNKEGKLTQLEERGKEAMKDVPHSEEDQMNFE